MKLLGNRTKETERNLKVWNLFFSQQGYFLSIRSFVYKICICSSGYNSFQFIALWSLSHVQQQTGKDMLKGMFYPACLARVVFLFAFVVAMWAMKMGTTKANQDTTRARNAGWNRIETRLWKAAWSMAAKHHSWALLARLPFVRLTPKHHITLKVPTHKVCLLPRALGVPESKLGNKTPCYPGFFCCGTQGSPLRAKRAENFLDHAIYIDLKSQVTGKNW